MYTRENRIYVDGKLVNICYNEYALMCNLTNYRKKYGDRVTIKQTDTTIMDEEKKEWLNKLGEEI